MPLSPEARRALEEMNRGPLKTPPSEAPAPAKAAAAPDPAAPAERTPPPGASRPTRRAARSAGIPSIPGRSGGTGEHLALPAVPPGTPPELERLVPGSVAATGRPHYVHERVVDAPLGEGKSVAEVLTGMADAGTRMPPGIVPDVPAPQWLFLDIESVGLYNGPLFIVGLLMLESGALVARQLFARDYSEEPGVLEATAALLRERPGLFTFNGKSFDMPYIANRCATHGLPMPEEEWHTDLLLVARRHWRRFLPNCRLQTIEQHVCGRRRVDDIPGEMMGQVYHDFVRTGDATDIRRALHHNLLDLVTMAEMLCVLSGAGK